MIWVKTSPLPCFVKTNKDKFCIYFKWLYLSNYKYLHDGRHNNVSFSEGFFYPGYIPYFYYPGIIPWSVWHLGFLSYEF